MSSMAVPQSVPVMGAPRGHGARSHSARGAGPHTERVGPRNASVTSDAIAGDVAEKWSRRILAAIAVVAVVMIAMAGMRIVTAQHASAALAGGVGDHVLAAPGEQLAEIAARTRPNGADPAIYLAQVEALNVRAGEVMATQWRVVLLPTP